MGGQEKEILGAKTYTKVECKALQRRGLCLVSQIGNVASEWGSPRPHGE